MATDGLASDCRGSLVDQTGRSQWQHSWLIGGRKWAVVVVAVVVAVVRRS